jgi:hypothetical protein
MTRYATFVILGLITIAVQATSGMAQVPASPTAPNSSGGGTLSPPSVSACNSAQFTCKGSRGKLACCDSPTTCKQDGSGTPFCAAKGEPCDGKNSGQVVCDGPERATKCCPAGTSCMYGPTPWLWGKKPFVGCGSQCAEPALQCGRDCCTWTQQCLRDKKTGAPLGCGPMACGDRKTLCGDPLVAKDKESLLPSLKCCEPDEVCVAKPGDAVSPKRGLKFSFIDFSCERRGALCKKSPGFVCGPSEAKGTCCLPSSTCHHTGTRFVCCPPGYTVNGNGTDCIRMANYVDDKGASTKCEPGFIPVWNQTIGEYRCTPIPICMRPEQNAPEICAPVKINEGISP